MQAEKETSTSDATTSPVTTLPVGITSIANGSGSRYNDSHNGGHNGIGGGGRCNGSNQSLASISSSTFSDNI